MFWKLTMWLLVGSLALAGCGGTGSGLNEPIRPEEALGRRVVTATPKAVPVKLDEPFQLPYGGAAELQDAGFRLTFVNVVEDGRCPADVQCVAAGEARFQIQVDQQRGVSPTMVLSTRPDRNFATVGRYKIELLSVSPERIRSDAIPTDEAYTLTLKISAP